MTAGPSLSEEETQQIWTALATDDISSLTSWAQRPYTSDAKQQPTGDLSIAKQLQVAELLGELYALQRDVGDDTLAFKNFKAKTGTSTAIEDYAEFKGQLVTHGVRIGEAPVRCVPPARSVQLSSLVRRPSSDHVLTEAFAKMRGCQARSP